MIKLTDLADELLDIIIDHCPLESLATCLVSNKAIRSRCLRDGVWRAQALARWRCIPDVRGGGASGAASRIGCDWSGRYSLFTR